MAERRIPNLKAKALFTGLMLGDVLTTGIDLMRGGRETNQLAVAMGIGGTLVAKLAVTVGVLAGISWMENFRPKYSKLWFDNGALHIFNGIMGLALLGNTISIATGYNPIAPFFEFFLPYLK